jgi:septum formation protein
MTAFILASGSTSRAQILRGAGVPFTIEPAHIDEDSVKAEMHGKSSQAVAEALAERKALHVSTIHPHALVLGADQVLMLGDELMSKAETVGVAATHLRKLRGKQHQLIGALVLAKNGAPVWRHTEISTLWMRDFSDAFLDGYLKAEGDAVLGSVGCYRFEGLGAQLFVRVEGDYFSILGLSLLPLLAALRDQGVLQR